jgi:glycosyltransferase involved in cell wall biosynthesis
VDAKTKSAAMSYADRLPLRYIEQEKQGVASARNRGIAAASAELIVLLDDDVIPGPHFVLEHASFHSERTNEEAALLGYVTWHEDMESRPFMHWYGEYGGLFGYSMLRDNQKVDARYFYSCNISLKRSFLISHGGFDQSLTVMEDNELGFRLAQQGMELFHRKAAIGFHYQTFTFEQSCLRLEAYSGGLNAFLLTDAGRAMVKRRSSLLFRLAELAVRITAPLFSPLLASINSDRQMPRTIYRLLYWYYGSYRSFWSRADKLLVSGHNRK